MGGCGDGFLEGEWREGAVGEGGLVGVRGGERGRGGGYRRNCGGIGWRREWVSERVIGMRSILWGFRRCVCIIWIPVLVGG